MPTSDPVVDDGPDMKPMRPALEWSLLHGLARRRRQLPMEAVNGRLITPHWSGSVHVGAVRERPATKASVVAGADVHRGDTHLCRPAGEAGTVTSKPR